MARWSAIHGEAIYGTRPWAIYGEGPAKNVHGAFKEDVVYTAQDIRFTTKGDILYAIAQDWPAGSEIVVHALAPSAGKVRGVALLGYHGKLDWQQTAGGLVVKLPAKKVCEYTCALKIQGADLKPAR
jgi:alpha-L-fucosidase